MDSICQKECNYFSKIRVPRLEMSPSQNNQIALNRRHFRCSCSTCPKSWKCQWDNNKRQMYSEKVLKKWVVKLSSILITPLETIVTKHKCFPVLISIQITVTMQCGQVWRKIANEFFFFLLFVFLTSSQILNYSEHFGLLSYRDRLEVTPTFIIRLKYL